MEETRSMPDVLPAPITDEQYFAGVPEKFELVDGYLFDPPHRHDTRARLLALLLTNEGLARAVQLAPPERWKEALRQVYDTEDFSVSEGCPEHLQLSQRV
ncbi:MAG: hypothetical protein ACE5JP_03450 [Candidatus Bipolaricaulia bacterium]